jgi:hypothetical protein
MPSLAFMFLPAILGVSHYLLFVPVINTVLLLGAPMLPTRLVKISTYLQPGPFFSITFILINLKLLIILGLRNVIFHKEHQTYLNTMQQEEKSSMTRLRIQYRKHKMQAQQSPQIVFKTPDDDQ